MHFVDTKKCKTSEIIDYLKKHEDNSKKRLVKDKKAKPYGLANKKMQEPLSKCFKQNCGYCGTQALYNEEETEGQIDHYKPKSIVKSEIYKWSNYIWSCSVCNQRKGDYYKIELMILNPTNKTDCDCLAYNNGEYYVKSKNFEKRMKITENKTRINNISRIRKRRRLYNDLDKKIRTLLEEKKDLQDNLKNSYKKDKMDLIEFLNDSSFKLLIKEIFIPKLLKEYPNLKHLIKEILKS